MDHETLQVKSVAQSARSMGIAVFLSRIFGLVREQVFAFFFGASAAMDAFNVAFRIPNLLRDLFAEGAMSSALVPTFVTVRKDQGATYAWRVAGLVFRVLFVIVSALSILGFIFAPQLVALYAGAFARNPEQFALTVHLTRILFGFFPLVALAAAYMAILNASGFYFWPAFASALFNVSSVAGGLFFVWLMPKFGVEPIIGMAFGVVMGGAVQAFCQLPTLRKAGYLYPKSQGFVPWYREPALRKILLLIAPGTIGLAATQINILVNTMLATGLGDGAVSWLNYAFRLLQFPIGIFGVSYAVATLSRASEAWAAKNYAGFSQTIESSLKNVFALNAPAAMGLIVLSEPIIELLFQYGQFTARDTEATAMALSMYSLGLVFYSCVKVLVPICYTLGKVRIAVISSLISVAANVGFNFWIVDELGFVGLALGTSLTTFLNVVVLFFAITSAMARTGSPIRTASIVKSYFVQCAVSVSMGYLLWKCGGWLSEITLFSGSTRGFFETVMARAIHVACLVALGVGYVAFVGKCFRIPETREVLNFFSKKIKKRL